MPKPMTRALESLKASTGELTEAKATEASGEPPNSQTTAGSPVLATENNRGGPIGASAARNAEGRSATVQSEATTLGRERESPASPATFPTPEQFAAIFPKLRISLQDSYYEAIRAACGEFGIDTPERVAAFLAQVGHETGGLQYLEELGGTSWYVRYEGRRDLGNTTQGDGIRYYGRGVVQLTGKANYVEFGRRLGLNLAEAPQQAAEMPAAARIGGAFWQMRGLNDFCDGTDEGFRRITIRLNGGVNGLQDRFDRWRAIRKIMGLAKGA